MLLELLPIGIPVRDAKLDILELFELEVLVIKIVLDEYITFAFKAKTIAIIVDASVIAMMVILFFHNTLTISLRAIS